jgi:hypothetical protein
MTSKKFLIALGAATVLVIVLAAWKIHTPIAPPSSVDLNGPGTISTTTDGYLLYTDNKAGFKFRFPQGWHIGSGARGHGDFQLYNYDETLHVKDRFAADARINKISGGIGSSSSFVNDEYPEKARRVENVEINNQKAIREDIELIGGERFRLYFMPVPSEEDRFLSMSIAGDPTNFHVLDQIAQSLEWLR